MTSLDDDPPLTERQQLMMAYVDDELSPSERREFEERMASDSELARETVQLENLLELSRSMTLSEPSDQEVRRFWARFYNRTEWQIGWVLMLGGLALASGEALFLLLTTEAIDWPLKVGLVSALVGGGMLLWNTLRLKLRTNHYDRYRGVMR